MKAWISLVFLFVFFKLPAQEIGINPGSIAPELSLPGTDSQMINLSSLKGQVVLVEFWASWNKTSRIENQTLVKSYSRFHDRKFSLGTGFTVYSVSLDKYKGQWTSAIDLDGLIWPSNVCDFKYWECSALKDYQVNNIPAYFLVDGNGLIIKKLSSLDQLEKILLSYQIF